MKKKILFSLLIIISLFMVTGCDNSSEEETITNKTIDYEGYKYTYTSDIKGEVTDSKLLFSGNNDNYSISFWLDTEELTFENAKSYISIKKDEQLDEGVVVSNDSSVQTYGDKEYISAPISYESKNLVGYVLYTSYDDSHIACMYVLADNDELAVSAINNFTNIFNSREQITQ